MFWDAFRLAASHRKWIFHVQIFFPRAFGKYRKETNISPSVILNYANEEWNNTTPTVKISRKKGETKIRTRYRQAENEDITELLVGEKKKGIIALRRT
jgi:hypothetical protein